MDRRNSPSSLNKLRDHLPSRILYAAEIDSLYNFLLELSEGFAIVKSYYNQKRVLMIEDLIYKLDHIRGHKLVILIISEEY